MRHFTVTASYSPLSFLARLHCYPLLHHEYFVRRGESAWFSVLNTPFDHSPRFQAIDERWGGCCGGERESTREKNTQRFRSTWFVGVIDWRVCEWSAVGGIPTIVTTGGTPPRYTRLDARRQEPDVSWLYCYRYYVVSVGMCVCVCGVGVCSQLMSFYTAHGSRLYY